MKPSQQNMFATEDLPLFSGTPQRAEGSPFRPQVATRQERLPGTPEPEAPHKRATALEKHARARKRPHSGDWPTFDTETWKHCRALKAGSFDEAAERSVLFTAGGSAPRPGVTREQLARFFARREAVQTAQRQRYKWGESVADFWEKKLAEGWTLSKGDCGSWHLWRDDETLSLRHNTARAFVLTIRNAGSYATNY